MAIDQAFFREHSVELNEAHAIKHIIKEAKKLLKACEKEEAYEEEKIKFYTLISDFKEATTG